jgi:2-iminobutanoate/2-iminopropanoate deaminase
MHPIAKHAAALALAALLTAPAVAKDKAPPAGPVFTPSDMPYPFSSAVRVGDVLYLSGQLGAVDSGGALVPGGIEPETRAMFARIGKTLNQHGLTFDQVFKCQVFLADMADWPKFNAIYATYFKKDRYPARSAMGVNGLALGARVEMECWAWAGG